MKNKKNFTLVKSHKFWLNSGHDYLMHGIFLPIKILCFILCKEISIFHIDSNNSYLIYSSFQNKIKPISNLYKSIL